MKKRIVVAFAVVVALAMTAAAQQAACGGSKDRAAKASDAPKKPVSLSGHVSKDGKAFVAEGDSTAWSVENPDALAESLGARVIVRANLDIAKHAMEVIAVRIDTVAGARLQDAAFRR
jgi:hypothetical protein